MNKKSYRLPQDFEGEFNLALIAFERRHQADVDVWLNIFVPLEAQRQDFKVYEFPTVGRFSAIGRRFLDGAMRSGIPDLKARGRTITLYQPLEQIMRSLGLTQRDQIYAMLLDRQGRVLWRTSGRPKQEDLNEIVAIMNR